MSTAIISGKKVSEIELLDFFKPSDGMITQIYGRIGQGKTYLATKLVLEDLSRGEMVYVNWKIDYKGFDGRKSFVQLFLSLILPWRNRFYMFPKDNLREIEIDEFFLDKFENLTDCKVYLDEGHVAFDSYEMARMSLKKRMAVLHTRHFDRSIIIISQRPTAVHVTMRANVNIFYKVEKMLTWPLLLFRLTQYEDIKAESVDEEGLSSSRWIFGSKDVANAYDSKYRRANREASQRLAVEGYDLTYYERLKSIIALIWHEVQSKVN